MRFDEFATARLPALLRYATVLSGDADLARDLVQEVLVRALLKWRRVSAADEPYAYVRTMVTNEYLSLMRRRQVRAAATRYEALDAPVLADPASAVTQRLDLWRAVLALPLRQRAVIVLRYYEDMSDADIAQTLGCRQTTVRGYAHRALSALRVDISELTASGRSQS
jgi:RNA polymerase sigma-70 factor (sigma-E family)